MAGLHIGIVGAGVGGLTAAIALQKQGHRVTVYEQSAKFSHVGADINLTPNVVRALDGVGVGPGIRRTGARLTQPRVAVLATLLAADHAMAHTDVAATIAARLAAGVVTAALAQRAMPAQPTAPSMLL